MLTILKERLLARSRIAVWLVAGLLFLLGILQVAQGFIDTRNYRDGILAAIKEHTGRDVIIKGKVSVQLLPLPTIYVQELELRDAESDSPAPAASVPMIRMRTPLASLFSDHPRISSIVLERPALELVRGHDHTIHWDWLNAGLLNLLAGSKAEQLTLEILDGRVLYHDKNSYRDVTISNINAYAVTGAQPGLRGSFTLFGHDLKLVINTEPGGTPVPAGAIPLDASLTGSGNVAQLQGHMDFSGEKARIDGTLTLEAQDIRKWVQPAGAENTEGSDMQAGLPEPQPLPLKLTGKWAQQGGTVKLTEIQLKGLDSEGGGNLGLAWDQWRPVITADMQFATMNYDAWRSLADAAFLKAIARINAASYDQGDDQAGPLSKDVRLALNIASKELKAGTQLWKEVVLAANMADAAVTVNQFHVALPGQSVLTIFGVISEGTTGGLRFEGSMETKGKSLRKMLTAFDPSAAVLPDVGFGQFYARSNLFISAQQMRLSEADVQISELRLNGGLVAYYDAKPRMEADVKLSDIDFDYFRDAWRGQELNEEESEAEEFFLQFDRSMNFNWLRNLETNIDLKVSVDGFTFLERQGDSASFRLFVKQGEFGIYNIRFYYPTETIDASFNLNVKGEQPLLSIVLNAQELDTDYFSLAHEAETPSGAASMEEAALKIAPQSQIVTLAQAAELPSEPSASSSESMQVPSPPPPPTPEVPDPKPDASVRPAPPQPPVWSEELIDFGWMQGWNATFDVSLGELRHDGMVFNDLKLQAKLEDNVVSFQNLAFDYWQGRCTVNGTVYGGQVPGLAISFTLYNAELHDILNDLTGRDNITGRVSISGAAATSGVNYLSWVSQADAKLVMAGRGVNVQGVNLQGVVEAVSISRTAADVFNNVNQALVNGATEFTVDGNLNIKNGVMKTPGITLKTDGIIGNLTGDIQLVPWTMDLSTLFQFPGLTSETIPTMTVQLSGSLAEGELRTDTSSLEAYVAKRIISR